MNFYFKYHDYIVVVLSFEIFILTAWGESKHDVTLKKDENSAGNIDPVEIVTYVYLNFLFMKQIIVQMYADMITSMAYHKQQLTTIDLREKAKKP